MAEKFKHQIKTISKLFKFNLLKELNNNNNLKVNSTTSKPLKEIILEWCSKSSAHGFPSISSKNNNYVIRVVWIILMLTSWSYCFYTIIKTIMKYYEYGFDTSVDYINQTPFPFPAIDICNLSPFGLNLFNKEVIDILVQDVELTNILGNTTIDQEIIEKYYGINGTRSELEKYDESIGNTLRFYEYFYDQNKKLFDTIPHNLNLMVFNCAFKNIKCSKKDFKGYRNYYYGNCYRFNWDLNDLKMISRAGSKYGLRLELFIDFFNLNSNADGFKILINNQSLKGYPEENGIDISPGYQTNIALSRTYVKNLDWPYNQCLDDLVNDKYSHLIKNSDILQKIKSIGEIEYDQNLCLKLCLQKYISDMCKCYDLSGPQYYYKAYNGCYYSKDKYCSLISDIVFHQNDQCSNKCPDRCTKFVYKTTVSFSKFPSKWYLDHFVNDTRTKQVYSKYFSLVNIFFNEMPYKMISQKEKIDLETLLGFIGGQLGIFRAKY
jgi:hypothetical protein